MGVSVCMCLCACVCVCIRVCVHGCVHTYRSLRGVIESQASELSWHMPWACCKVHECVVGVSWVCEAVVSRQTVMLKSGS